MLVLCPGVEHNPVCVFLWLFTLDKEVSLDINGNFSARTNSSWEWADSIQDYEAVG